MSFGTYVRQLIGVVFASTLALGLIVGVALLIFGDFTMNVEGDFEIGRFEGLWLVLGLPLLSVLVFAILSPLSFLISRLYSRRRQN